MTSQPLVLQAIEALKRGDRRGGAALLQRDLDIGAPSPDRCRTISRLAAEIGEIDMAIEASRRSVVPGSLERMLNHWAILATYGRADEAMAEVDRLAASIRDHPAVLHFSGTIASEQGRFEEADEFFRRALAITPDALPIWFALAMNKTFTPGDPDLAAMEALAHKAERADPETHARFLYALGKAWDDLGETDRAFGYFARGAAIRSHQEPYDRTAARSLADQVMKGSTPDAFAKLTPSRADPQRALFVTGLPRSGTTLVQQMLTAHSTVTDGGEVNLWRPALIPTVDYTMEGALAYQQGFGGEDPWGEVANDYCRFIDMRFPVPGLVVDKSLGQTVLLGLLLHSLPDARVVWLRRRPEDVALSCFRTFFTNIRWSWSLADIGHHFRIEDDLIAHWRALFPDRIRLVEYEDLVGAPDEGIAAILGHFGLGGEPGVRNFHLSERSIRTASVRQVRAPVTTARIGQAEAYSRHLDEFRRGYAG